MCKLLAKKLSDGCIEIKDCSGNTCQFNCLSSITNDYIITDTGVRFQIEEFGNVSNFKEFFEGCLCAAASGASRPVSNELGKFPLGIMPIPVFAPKDFKQETPIYLYQWSQDGEVCLTSDPEGLNIVNLNNYTMANIAGAVIPPDLAKLTTPSCVTLCIPAGGSITLADVLAEAIADGLTLPDGTAPTGLLLQSITKFSIGQIGKDADGNNKKDGSQIVYFDGDEAINAGSTYCPKTHPILTDEDCDGFIAGEDLTKTLENGDANEPALVRVCGSFIPLDTDDDDSAVQ